VSNNKMRAIHIPTQITLTFRDVGDIMKNKEKGLKMVLKLLKRTP